MIAPALPGQLRPMRFWACGGEIITDHNRVISSAEAVALLDHWEACHARLVEQGQYERARAYAIPAQDLTRAMAGAEMQRRASGPINLTRLLRPFSQGAA